MVSFVASTVMFTKKAKIHLALAIILLTAAFFFRLGRADTSTDTATYLYRSLGYVDYMSSILQTTPLQWFSTVPWWAHLSFHDAPPLAFILYHFALAFSSNAVFAARAVSALCGIGVGILLWCYTYKRASVMAAWFSLAGYFALSTLITLQRTTLLESTMIIWLAGGFFAFYNIKKHPRYWYVAAVCFAAALLTKYTAIFILFGPALYLLLNRDLLKTKHAWRAAVIFIALLSPVLIYNIAMWRSVGHPDLQVSTFLKIDTGTHWTAIQRTISNSASLKNFFVGNGGLFFPTVALLALAAAVYIMRRAVRTRELEYVVLAGAAIGSLISLYIIGGNYWYSAAPQLIVALLFARSAADLFAEKRTPKIIVAVIVLCLSGGIANTITTNYLYTEPPHLLNFGGHESNTGWNELDATLTTYFYPRSPQAFANIWGFYNEKTALREEFARIQQPEGVVPYHGAIIFDSRISWFPRLWYLERWNLYRRMTVLSVQEYIKLTTEKPTFLIDLGFRTEEFSYIESLVPAPHNPKDDALLAGYSTQITSYFTTLHAPTKIIYGPDGVARFKIYGPLAN